MPIPTSKNVVRGAVTVGLLVILIFIGKAVLDWRERMQSGSTLTSDKNSIEATVTIQRPISEVFGFYQDFKNLPSFLGDVMAIEPTGTTTSRWTIEGPFGIQAHWTIEVTEVRKNELIRYETVTLPETRTYWEIYFAPGSNPDETEVREVMKAPLGQLGRAALALIGKFPASEVNANLHRFKQVMETGRVTDTSYSVPGKFSEATNQDELKR
jgi:uncharacterized membrane protein